MFCVNIMIICLNYMSDPKVAKIFAKCRQTINTKVWEIQKIRLRGRGSVLTSVRVV